MAARLVILHCDGKPVFINQYRCFLKLSRGIADNIFLKDHGLGRTVERKSIAAAFRSVVFYGIFPENVPVRSIGLCFVSETDTIVCYLPDFIRQLLRLRLPDLCSFLQ